MNYKNISKIVDSVKSLNDQEIEVFIQIAKDRGMVFDEDYLRLIIKDLRG